MKTWNNIAVNPSIEVQLHSKSSRMIHGGEMRGREISFGKNDQNTNRINVKQSQDKYFETGTKPE